MQQEDYALLFGEWTRLLDSQNAQAAEAFYFARILPAILPVVKARSGNIPKYNGLISLLGFTPETIVLTSRLLKPKKLVILHTPETANFIDIAKEHSGLPPSKIKSEKFLHDDEHIDDIYLALKKALGYFKPTDRIAIELTGGKKTMGIQLSNAVAALRHNQKMFIDVVYIDYDEYMPKYRKPVPETSRLLIIGDPPASAQNVFGKVEEISSETREIVVNPIFSGRGYPLIRNLAFVLMPFSETWSDRIWRIIKSECEGHKFQAIRADELSGEVIMEDVWRGILQARLIIADITNKNPNVLYELGIAHTIGKRCILLTQDVKNTPFDLNRYRLIIYEDNSDGYEKLVAGLRKTLSNAGL